jgi:hypothetical protein
MKQAIAGVAPAELEEVTVMTVWPSIAAYPAGRSLGRLYALRWPDIYVFRAGNLLALLSLATLVPLALYFYKLLPGVGTRYCLTNRRLVVKQGITTAERGAIELDGFDSIEVEVQPGQQWFRAGDLVLKREGDVVLRLSGVSRPDVFRHTCLQARVAYVGVRQAAEQQSRGRSA